VDRLDMLVALTTPSLEKHSRLLGAGRLLVVDSQLVSVGPLPGVEIVDIPCTRLARAAGSDKLVSIVALGAVLARRAVVSEAAVREALAAIVGAKHPELLAANLTALESGMAAARHSVAEATPSP
jgi:Pyruvate/2-oxoacid:ferredoxin oxidoreductase gamma subunit